MPAPVLQFKRGNAGVAGTVPALRPGEPAISLNNFDFFIGIDTSVANNKFFGSHRYWGREDGTNSLRLNLVDKDGSNYIAIKSPNTLAGIVTYQLPGTQGSPNTVLKNDGSGNLTWSNTAESPVFTGIATFTDTTDNTLGNVDTGSVQIDGGVGIAKNVTIGAGLSVAGESYFIGTATFYGGQINLGDSDGDNISVAGEFVSNLVPNTSNTYDLGLTSKRWRNAYYSGSVDVTGNLSVSGNVTIGGTTVTLLGQDVYIQNKDIILGYTTSVSGDASTDVTANHAGVAIASTQGTPLVPFSASGINTLPDTYKQMMWFRSGTLGFSTDAFAFNYGVAIGTTTMANGVRLAVGPNVTVTDTTITAPVGNFTSLSGSLTGTISTATRATTVDTVTASDLNSTHYLTFVNSHNSPASAETVYTDDGIYYNPGTNTFTTQHALFTGDVTVSGTLTGTATTATRATLVDTTGTSDNATYYVTFVDTSAGQNSETLRVGTALSVNASTGNFKASGDLIAGSGYLASANGTRAMYMYDTSGDVAFQGKVVANNYRSTTNVNDTLTFVDLDATLARNLYVTGIATVFSNLVVGGDVRINGSDIQASDGNTNITLTSNTLTTFAGDIKVTGNDIQASDGNTNITMTSNTLTSVSGDLKVGGGDIQASDGTTAISLSSTSGNVTVAGDLQVNGNKILSSTGATAITLSANDVQITDDLTVGGNLYVNGNTTQVNTSSLSVEDRTIQLGIVDGSAPSTATTWDLGVLFNYYTDSAKQSAVVWEHGDARFKFGSVISDGGGTGNNNPQITVSTFAPIEIGSLWVTDCAGTSSVITCTGSTRNLENITIDAGTF